MILFIFAFKAGAVYVTVKAVQAIYTAIVVGDVVAPLVAP